jgi:putative FmdB family regulatory protein
MPTYDYECQKCGHVFEVFHAMSEAPKVKCEKTGCSGKATKQIGAGSGLIFKGSGFYITDYKDKKSGNGASESKSDASDSGSSSESKSEAKGETKAKSKAESSGKSGSKSESGKSKAEKTAK